MANKRMFSVHVVESGRFLDLPPDAQALYLHLSMHADDDGFIDNARQIARMSGVAEKQLQLLTERGWLIAFDSGVVAIRHWRMNNTLRHDRYQPTPYGKEKSELTVEENQIYSRRPAAVALPAAAGLPVPPVSGEAEPNGDTYG